ncbi:hypothetical protein FACS189454_05010 [Planctomycetales bacterium]|nr:hypothetical protein FACS189454_05010 [Planctomycetales bacterium]
MSSSTRSQIYTVFIVIAASLILGRIMAVNRIDYARLQQDRLSQIPKQLAEKEKRLRSKNIAENEIQESLEATRIKLQKDAQLECPVFSANDRSRWDTIRVLAEPEMRVPEPTTNATAWYAIDKAQNEKNWDTIDMVKHTGHLYSSKPPLLPTVLALPYYIIYHSSGKRLSLGKTPFQVVRLMLIVCNLIPIIIAWVLLSRLIEYFGTTDWGRIFATAFVCFGTFISTFAVTLNNHLPAVFCITVALYSIVKITVQGENKKRYYLLAGFFGTFAVACELPALLFLVFTIILLFFRNRVHPTEMSRFSAPHFVSFLIPALLVAGAFFTTNYIAHQTVLPAYSQKDWYFFEYERGGVVRQSYWHNPQGLDKGEASRAAYIFHCLIGHHGLFSLTPVWFLSFIGLGMWLRNNDYRSLAVAILITGFVVFTFYMMQSQAQRNYGGMTSGLRWMFWFIPLWSVPLVSAADWLSRTKLRRSFAFLCLAVSVMSVAYPVWNPWTMPWLFQWLNN